MIISKAEAAREVNVIRSMIEKWQVENPQPDFFVLVNGKYKIDTEKQSWINRKTMMDETRIMRTVRNKKNSEAKKRNPNGVDYSLPSDMGDLSAQAARADMYRMIHESKIKEEQAKQQEIKTYELKKDLAPMYMINHFFSFAEKIIQRAHRKPHDIMPQIAAYCMARENRLAEALMSREIESIVRESVNDLIKEIEREGLRIKEEEKQRAAELNKIKSGE